MLGVLLTQDSGMILGPIAKILGYLMEGIFFVLDKVGIPNIGLAIILFTIIINLLMSPLTVKQQKFSKLNAKMQPELQAIQKKYKDKKDNNSVMAMNEETQAVYAKYGVSPTGSCVQLLIQMPILFALYRVIYAMPAYVTKIKDAFFPLVNKLMAQEGSAEFIQSFKNSNMYSKQFKNELFASGNVEYVQNTFIDCLNKASTSEWLSISEKYPELASDVTATLEHLDVYNSFLGLNIANSPSYIIGEAFKTGTYALIIGAIAIPVLSALTQWINTKLMPQPSSNSGGNEATDSMAQSMKMMNTTMPLMSAFFCLTLPAGMGIYWIAGSVVRSIQQVVINKHIDKMDLDSMIAKNLEKNKGKLEKKKEQYAKLAEYANQNTKNVDRYKNQAEKDAAYKAAMERNSKAKPGSIAAKANMVKDYNERNNK
ncbi:MAG: YidC/Oxa1 family membrane protein insertase [Lachnospiraceae bacterium]|nr:YidC/Oxa1 family membrane protein insertase [Lachnospiraceae bacterium]